MSIKGNNKQNGKRKGSKLVLSVTNCVIRNLNEKEIFPYWNIDFYVSSIKQSLKKC